MVKRDTSWGLFAFASVATVLLLGAMYLMAVGLNSYQVSQLEEEILSLEAEQRSHVLGSELARDIGQSDCNTQKEWIERSENEIWQLQQEVASYEEASRMEDPKYKGLKKRHTNLVIQNYLDYQGLKDDCEENSLNIIYIYSNEVCARCDDQGTVLTYFNRNYENITIHPLDTDLNMRHVNFLEDFYEVERYPALIIEGELYEGFQDREDMEHILELD